MSKIFKDKQWVEQKFYKEKTRIVTKPKILGTNAVVPNSNIKWSFEARPLINGVAVKKFIVDWGDGSSVALNSNNNKAYAYHSYTGSIGTSYKIKVTAIDSLGNDSEYSEFTVSLVKNRPPTSPNIHGVPSKVPQDTEFTIKINGSNDPEGDTIKYKVFGNSLIFSKTENIVNNEEITVKTPVVNEDKVFTISAIAVDDKGNQSDATSINFIVKYNPLEAPTINIANAVNENSTLNGRIVIDDYNGVTITVQVDKGGISNLNQNNGTFVFHSPDITDGDNDTAQINAYYTKDGFTSPSSTKTIEIVYVPIVADSAIQVVDFKSDEQENDGFEYN